jgi:hypothetical protein
LGCRLIAICFQNAGRLLLCTAALLLNSCSPDLPDDVSTAYENLPDQVDYNLHVKPILSDKCFACHGPDPGKRKAELRLDIPEAAFAILPKNPGKVAIDPGDLDGSELFHRILSSDPQYLMPDPESHLSLSSEEKAILIKWIEDGAVYKPHWAFQKPAASTVPDVSDEEWVVNPIDNFILDKLDQEKMSHATEAEKELLLRRVSLDLTGLPPTLRETEDFVKDPSPDAYEKQVDRLLASPHYGEKMAVDWLDLARFADSHGYSMDRLRDMSPYRDWVIKSFNDNFPYDKFIHWQLGGDLMPNPTKEMIIATAFNRNHQQNMEGGIIEEEFQNEYVVDRTNTFGDAFLGLSVGCAKCHDHKFDPITQKNYYELFSFFNNVKEAGQISVDNTMPAPTLLLPTEAQEKIIEFLKTRIVEQEGKVLESKNNSLPDFEKWLNANTYQRLSREKIPQAGLLAEYGFDRQDLKNAVNPAQVGVMKRQSGNEKPIFEKRGAGKVLTLNGDAWLELNNVGVFRKSDAFTIGIWVNIPSDLAEGVVFHKTLAERLFNFRGYHLYLKEKKLQVSMAHAAPSDAITRVTQDTIPREQWIQLTMTYDGSSKADGLKLYMDGKQMAMETQTDQLVKDILFNQENIMYRSKVQPGLQVGAWDRGWGLKGAKADDIVVYERVLTPFEITILARTAAWSQYTTKNRQQLSEADLEILKEYYLSAVHPTTRESQNTLRQLRTALADSTEKIEEVMVMQEMQKPKEAFILLRGNYDARGEEVFPNTPASLLAFPENLPRNRYGLAQWLTDRNHPLTARVAVNRFWQNFFGTGLVKTAEDFGSQGELPSHPDLLDWLAIEFMKSDWNVKALNKLIAMSATYRQDSRPAPEARDRDPENRLISHGPASRLSAEMIRDNALAASGLMNKQIGGKSVKPYQPQGLWEINNTSYTPDSGAAVYRRSLYVVIKRSVPNPTLATFDGPSRSSCIARRQKTNTPLQALVTLNDPTFIETARVLGEQMAKESNALKAIADTFKKLTGRTPSAAEVDLLAELRKNQLEKFIKNPEKVTGWLHAGQYRVASNSDTLQIAANAVVASTILNSDATITKR